MAASQWSESEQFVKYSLEHHEKTIADLAQKVEKSMVEIQKTQIKILTELAGLRVKAGVWGVIGGALPVLIGIAAYLLKSQF